VYNDGALLKSNSEEDKNTAKTREGMNGEGKRVKKYGTQRSACSGHTIQKVTMCASVQFISSNLLCLLYSLPGFPERLEDVLETDPSFFRILAKNVEGIAFESALYAWEFWHLGLDRGGLGKGGAVLWVEAVGRVSDALDNGHVLGEAEVDRCYAGHHRPWIKVGDLAYVGLCCASQESNDPARSLLRTPNHAFCSDNASFRIY